MTLLAQAPARPRRVARRPSYPAVAAVLMVTACSGGGAAAPASDATSPEATKVIVAAAPPPRDEASMLERDPGEVVTEDDLAMGAPVSFPEDTAEPPMVGCGGGCPPAYVLSTQAKDQVQIAARVRYCAKVGSLLWPGKHERFNVAAEIDLEGHAKAVRVQGDASVPEAIRGCIERLVMSAQFDHDPAFERTTNASIDES